ncbi:MAG TPA: hypothetical protein VJQ85_07810 [Gaiellaceae bacterium]|nr:hypothetical protein [Gaiellaceae bacterium]
MLAKAAVLAVALAMHPHLGAHLSGMGQHGTANLTLQQAKGRICWTFDVPTKGITAASVRDAHGMKVAELGMHYSAKGCDTAPKKALALLESKPGAYRIWVDTKAHPGDLRGTLFAGMAHM